MILENGAGLEEWLTDLIKNSGTQARRVIVSKDLTLREGEDGQAHTVDPHLWMDVQNAVKYVENIRDGLSAADPAERDDDEDIDIERLPLVGVLQELDDASSIAALALWLELQ